MNDMARLPGIAGEIEETIGLEATARLLKARGGTDIEIPVRASGSALARIIGEAACEKMIARFGRGRFKLPAAGFRGRDAIQRERKARAMEMLKAGHSVREVSLACDVVERTVCNYKDELERDTRQGSLDL